MNSELTHVNIANEQTRTHKFLNGKKTHTPKSYETSKLQNEFNKKY